MIILHGAAAISIFHLTLGHLKDVESFDGEEIDQLSPPLPHLASAINNVKQGFEFLIFLAAPLSVDSIGKELMKYHRNWKCCPISLFILIRIVVV